MSAGGRSRTAALMLLLGVVAVLLAAMIVPIALYWSSTGTTIRESRSVVQQANEGQAASLAAENARERWTRFVDTPASRFVLADSNEAAADALKTRVAALFNDLNGDAGSVVITASEGPRTGVIALKIEASGTLAKSSLGRFLTALESGEQVVILNRFSARSIDRNRLRISIGGTAYRMGEPGT